jgi:pimeloyl-ACP methyl ester carboxylesterase
VIIGLGLLSTSQLALAGDDPILRTNTNKRVRQQRYHEINFARIGKPAMPRADELRGAMALRADSATCFLYPNLRSQAEIPCLAPLIQAYNHLPKTTRRVTTVRSRQRIDIAVHQVGTSTHQTILICIPGVMGDSASFRFMVGALANDYDFWLIDPPGCGDSEKPDPKTLGRDGYGPSAMAERELQAIAACFGECRRPVRALVVGHSLGGLVALRAFADPDLRARYAEVLNRVEGLVLLAPCNVFLNQANPDLASRAELSGLKVALGNGLGVIREAVAQHLAASYYHSHCLPREEVDHTVQVISDNATRNAFKAMLRQALPFDEKTRQPDFSQMLRLESWYTNVTLPCQIIWGKCDQTLYVAMGYMLERQLPNARLTVISDCKHSPNLECPAACARLVRDADRQIAVGTSRDLHTVPVADRASIPRPQEHEIVEIVRSGPEMTPRPGGD